MNIRIGVYERRAVGIGRSQVKRDARRLLPGTDERSIRMFSSGWNPGVARRRWCVREFARDIGGRNPGAPIRTVIPVGQCVCESMRTLRRSAR